ncbi:MAG TPA: hypothetical protein VNB06_06940, partial [Thermoanaerobaculia bacterium]|nr:hypothetical protein [Thermoanaerobaculia bacterium]
MTKISLALLPPQVGDPESAGTALAELLGGFSRWPADDLASVGPLPFLVVLATAGAASFFVSWLYSIFYSSRATGSEIHRAFPLL